MSVPPKTDVWYPFFVGDYRKDTARLSCEQHGAYRQLLDEYWITGPLPDDDAILARLTGLELRAWRKHRPHIERFFVVSDGLWRHGRVDRELAAAASRKVKAAGKAKAAAEARWGKPQAPTKDATSNAPSIPEAMLEDMHEECPPPSPSSQVVAFPEPSEKTKPQLSGQSAAPRKASRLPADWTPGTVELEYGLGQGLTLADLRRIGEDFRDYWAAKAGADATKLDWLATWRRWVRTDIGRQGQRRPGPPPAKRVSFV